MSELPIDGGLIGKALGYLATAGAAAATALWARKADVGRMIDQRWTGLSEAQEKRIERAEQRCDAAEAAHEKCEAALADVRAEIDALMRGRVAPYSTFQAPRKVKP